MPGLIAIIPKHDLLAQCEECRRQAERCRMEAEGEDDNVKALELLRLASDLDALAGDLELKLKHH